MADEAEFDEFVVARSQALVRSAYLLVQDEGLAEDLVQTALAKAWFAWRRIRTQRRTYAGSWSPPRRPGGAGDGPGRRRPTSP